MPIVCFVLYKLAATQACTPVYPHNLPHLLDRCNKLPATVCEVITDPKRPNTYYVEMK